MYTFFMTLVNLFIKWKTIDKNMDVTYSSIELLDFKLFRNFILWWFKGTVNYNSKSLIQKTSIMINEGTKWISLIW